MSAPSLRLSSEVGFKQWIEKAIDSPDPSVREEETSFYVQNVNAVIALIKFDTAALRSGGSFILRREGGSAPNRIERSRESRAIQKERAPLPFILPCCNSLRSGLSQVRTKKNRRNGLPAVARLHV